jgi:hypothetical protein
MDDDEPLELSDLDSELSDLPDMGDFGERDSPGEPGAQASSEDEFDSDFLPPAALTETPIWEAERPAAKGNPPKRHKAPKAAGSVSAGPRMGDGLDKTALFLSLAALSLLVLLILVLLFLNMIKAPAPPMIQPEVMGWNPAVAMSASARSLVPPVIDLGRGEPVTFEASTVLEVPEGLREARISLKLEPGDTVEDAGRRFGTPARTQGNQLFW